MESRRGLQGRGAMVVAGPALGHGEPPLVEPQGHAAGDPPHLPLPHLQGALAAQGLGGEGPRITPKVVLQVTVYSHIRRQVLDVPQRGLQEGNILGSTQCSEHHCFLRNLVSSQTVVSGDFRNSKFHCVQ